MLDREYDALVYPVQHTAQDIWDWTKTPWPHHIVILHRIRSTGGFYIGPGVSRIF